MSAKLFVTPKAVISRMQINADLEGVVEAVQSALSGAQIFIESQLPTVLEIRQHVCRYFLDSDAFSGLQPGGLFRAELPSYFIRSDVSHPVVVQVASDWKMSDATVAPASEYEIQFNDGHVMLDAKYFADKYVQVSCSTGFDPEAVLVAADPDNGIEEERGPEALPEWLEEAVLSYVGVVFDTSQATTKNTDAAATYKKAGEHALRIISPHLRKKGFVFRPL